MRKVYLFMMITLDGYFEGPGHDISWHNTDEEFAAFANEQDGQVGTILFGRRTYEMMANFWPKPAGQAEPTTAAMMNRTPKIVFSHSPIKVEWENTTLITENAVDEVRKLKQGSGKDIAIFGSNNFMTTIMPEGLIDEYRIMVNPIALGKGSSLFTGLEQPAKLERIGLREFGNGNVLLTYKPV